MNKFFIFYLYGWKLLSASEHNFLFPYSPISLLPYKSAGHFPFLSISIKGSKNSSSLLPSVFKE